MFEKKLSKISFIEKYHYHFQNKRLYHFHTCFIYIDSINNCNVFSSG